MSVASAASNGRVYRALFAIIGAGLSLSCSVQAAVTPTRLVAFEVIGSFRGLPVNYQGQIACIPVVRQLSEWPPHLDLEAFPSWAVVRRSDNEALAVDVSAVCVAEEVAQSDVLTRAIAFESAEVPGWVEPIARERIEYRLRIIDTRSAAERSAVRRDAEDMLRIRGLFCRNCTTQTARFAGVVRSADGIEPPAVSAFPVPLFEGSSDELARAELLIGE
ncbi:MAG: hypothetical protein ABL889_14555 [Terricaulis sp.]